MNINPISYKINFKANVKRETIYGKDLKKQTDNPSLEQILSEYDNEINYYKNKKESAKTLDEFMHSDEVNTKTKNLPSDDYIEIFNRPQWNTGNNNHKLLYNTNNKSLLDKLINGCPIEENIFYFSVPEKDGEIDKKSILSWLDRITEIIKANKF